MSNLRSSGSSRITAIVVIAAIGVLIALVYAPLLTWVGRASVRVSQLSTGAVLVLVTLIIGLRDTLHSLRVQPQLRAHGIGLLAWALVCLGVAGYVPAWSLPLALLSFCLAVSAVVSFLFGQLGVRELLPAIGGFFVLGVLVALVPSLDWPLRAVAGRQAANLLAALHQPVRFGATAGQPPELLLRVGDQLYVVATECNGFGLLSSAVLVATILAFYERLPWLSKVGLVAVAVPVAICANFLRIVAISLLAPRVPLPYGFVHEAVGLVFYFAALGVVYVMARRSATSVRAQSSAPPAAAR